MTDDNATNLLRVKNAAPPALRLVRRAIASSSSVAGADQGDSRAAKRPLFESAELLLTVSLFNAASKDASASGSSVLLTLPHQVHCSSRDTGCLITKDLPRAPQDYEATSGHYADLLRSAGCHEGLTVLPLRELTVAYMPFEAKRRLCHAYDYFLADQRICHRLGNKLGSYFLNKNRRKLPIPINLEARNLDEEVQRARRTVRICLTGSTVSCLVGRIDEHGSAEEDKDLLENIASACEQIFERLPTVSALYLRHPSCGNVPLFVSKTKTTLPTDANADLHDAQQAIGKRVVAKKAIALDKDLAELGETLWDKELICLPLKHKKVKKAAVAKRKSIGKLIGNNNNNNNNNKNRKNKNKDATKTKESDGGKHPLARRRQKSAKKQAK